jgi:hypothetical protein
MTSCKTRIKRTLLSACIASAFTLSPVLADDDRGNDEPRLFQRIAVFPVFLNTDINDQTVAEIVDASKDGKTLVYTDSQTEKLGFVDIKNPSDPQPAGVVALGGEPTSVAVVGDYALVGVNTSPSFTAPSGKLMVIGVDDQMVKATYDLGGQPDSVAVSPDGKYAAIAIENERDEDLGDGRPPQAPPGYLVIVDLSKDPTAYQLRTVPLTGIADLFPEDPEPEYVDINDKNIAVVTLQENNHIVLVDLRSGDVIDDFSAGSVDLNQIDTLENDLIEQNSALTSVPREPDGVSWVSNDTFATADEGDLDGGSRGITVFDIDGNVQYTSGNTLEHTVARLGHYPENRSENKGNEPENVEVGDYRQDKYMFVASERSSVVYVYQAKGNGDAPTLVQTLPAGVGPEGVKAIPRRNLLVAASEEDERGDKYRSVINIYKRSNRGASYPTVVSEDRSDGTPIPWAALSGLAADPNDDDTAYTIHDSFYQKARIYEMDIDDEPAVITKEIVLQDSMGKLAAVDAGLVNADGTVNIDQEGIAVRADGGFWIASEGRGTVGSSSRPFEFLNLLLAVSEHGVIEEVVTLPDSTNARQVRFGFEGVASVGAGMNEVVYVAFQREWADDPENHVRIGRYETAIGEWTFYYYPIETPLSANGGWVGLSEITALGDDKFAVIERDNQGGPDAVIKRIYQFDLAGLTPLPDPAVGDTPAFPVVAKTLVRDLVPDLKATGGLVLEKLEGMAVTEDGDVLVVNDNDGVDDSNGETQLLRFEELFEDEEFSRCLVTTQYSG